MKAVDLSYYILNRATEAKKYITQTELQNIVYLIHLNFLDEYKKKLVDEDFVTCETRPFIVELSDEYDTYGDNPLNPMFNGLKPNVELTKLFNDDEINTINDWIDGLIKLGKLGLSKYALLCHMTKKDI